MAAEDPEQESPFPSLTYWQARAETLLSASCEGKPIYGSTSVAQLSTCARNVSSRDMDVPSRRYVQRTRISSLLSHLSPQLTYSPQFSGLSSQA